MTEDTLHGVPALSTRRYEELAVGERFGPFVEPLAAGVADAVRGEIGVHVAGAGAPLGVLPLITLRVLRRALDGIVPGGVLVHQSFTVTGPLPASGDLEVGVSVTAQDRHPRGLQTTFCFALAHAGALAAVVEWTIRTPR